MDEKLLNKFMSGVRWAVENDDIETLRRISDIFKRRAELAQEAKTLIDNLKN